MGAIVIQEQIFQFQAETKHLLSLMIDSLYTNKEIFLRELISNASDALDRLRFEALVKPELLDSDSKLEIRLEADRDSRTLTVSDNGIGMSSDEIIANIGTIAKSGTRELRDKMSQGAADDQLINLIGRFGVGFYSSFMVANKVSLLTRRAGEETATLWESSGEQEYTLSESIKATRGTTITLYLKPANPEEGIEDFTDKWILARTVKRYSDFVTYPIIFKDQREEVEKDELEVPRKDAPKTIVVEDKVLNSMTPVWARPQSAVSETEYAEFYKHMFHDTDDPLQTIAAKAEGRNEYQTLLFIPSKAPYDLFYHAAEVGLRLYAKGVLVMEKCADLLPRYLRFVKGLVDAADLPLNISRQMLQQERQISQIRQWLTKRILDTLQSVSENDDEKYLRFWQQFGRALKEGVSADYDNRDRIIPLLLFQSSHDPEKLTTLKDYQARMKEEQQQIFYLTGESRRVVENSPHLEAFKARGYEVLYLVDPVDELLMQSLPEFEGKRLKSAAKGTISLGSDEESAQVEKELKQRQEESSELLQFIQRTLDKDIKEVRLTSRLTTSPVCLVGSEMDYSPQMERLLLLGQGGRPKQRRIMELNSNHEIFAKLQERFQNGPDEPALSELVDLLLGYALLAEGSELPDTVEFNRSLAKLITRSL